MYSRRGTVVEVKSRRTPASHFIVLLIDYLLNCVLYPLFAIGR